MAARRFATRWLAALLACVICVAATTVADVPLHAGSQNPPQEPAPKGAKFSHQQHVPDLWLRKLGEPETWRDCRGCHRFDAQNQVSAPQRECDSCHVGDGKLQQNAPEGFRDDLRGYRTRTRDAFRHHTHDMLECRECHLPYRRENLSDFDVVTGPGQCARCHEQMDEQAAVAMVKDLRWFRAVQDAATAEALGSKPFTPPAAGDEAKYAKRLVDVFAAPGEGINKTPPPPGGDFDHDDHAAIQCTDCHAGIPKAAAKDVGTGQIPAGACSNCHVGTDSKALAAAPATKTQSRTLNTLGAFTHVDHYRFLGQGAQPREPAVCTTDAFAKLKASQKGGCDVCHVQEKAAVGLVQPDFPFKSGFSKFTYLDCQGCHDVPGWTTRESPTKALHDSSDGALDGKNGWGACASCHVPGTGKMATERPKVDVERFANATFRFTTHTHPDITTKGIEAAGRAAIGECTTCHRARVPELPSRLAERPFRHATHLSKAPTAADCIVCHTSAQTAGTSGELAVDYRTYSLQSCEQCHRGGPITEVLAAGDKPVSREVLRFPHGPHVKAGASCTDCHELDGGSEGRDVATKPAAQQCNLCHDHVSGGAGKPVDPKAEGLFDGEAASCVRCHHEPAALGAPAVAALVEVVPTPRPPAGAADARPRVETTVFAGFAAPQFHPPGQKCTECHTVNLAPDPRYTGIRRTRVDHVFATAAGKVHRDKKEPANCVACHWTSRQSLGNAVPASDPLRELRSSPASAKTRQQFGNQPTGYPGRNADG